jgi:hypothetical protein
MKVGESARECRYEEEVDKYETVISSNAVRSEKPVSTGRLISSFLSTHIEYEIETNV